MKSQTPFFMMKWNELLQTCELIEAQITTLQAKCNLLKKQNKEEWRGIQTEINKARENRAVAENALLEFVRETFEGGKK